MNIAILGATSHIAKGLIINFLTKTNHEMSLFGRSNERINNFLLEEKLICDRILNYTEFFNYQYDVIINCVGIGRPEKIKEAGYGIFLITENFDNLVIEYLGKQPQAIYINFSSGAVFGKGIKQFKLCNRLFAISVKDIVCFGISYTAVNKLE